jgi:uncharacterized protein (TIGR02246 family)
MNTTANTAEKLKTATTARVTDPSRLPLVYEAALNAGDVEAMMELFAPGATMRTVTGHVLTTPEELRAEALNTIAAKARLTNTPRFSLESGDTSLVIVDWTLEATLPDGTRIKPTGTTTAVARLNEDGEWRFVVLNPLGTA